MKYFRKHPDLLIIANYPVGTTRVRKGRQTTEADISKIIVNTLTSTLGKTKKILLLTDASDEKHHRLFITRTAWDHNHILSIHNLFRRLIYNYQTNTICIVYHATIFGYVRSAVITPAMILFLRLTGKRIITVFLDTPKSTVYPTLKVTILYWTSLLYRAILANLSTTTIVGEKPFERLLARMTCTHAVTYISLTFRTLKERRNAGSVLEQELFPSPLKNLGLVNMLKNERGL